MCETIKDGVYIWYVQNFFSAPSRNEEGAEQRKTLVAARAVSKHRVSCKESPHMVGSSQTVEARFDGCKI